MGPQGQFFEPPGRGLSRLSASAGRMVRRKLIFWLIALVALAVILFHCASGRLYQFLDSTFLSSSMPAKKCIKNRRLTE